MTTDYKRLTPQEYYDRIVAATRDGTMPSFNIHHRSCNYRYIDAVGKQHHCIAGLLLEKDDEPRELAYVETLQNFELFNKRLPERFVISILTKLQKIHDYHAMDPTGWKPVPFLEQINKKFSLYFPNVKLIDPASVLPTATITNS